MKYFVGIKTLKNSPVRYYTMKNKVGASRMIAFRNTDSAIEFKNYLAKYRAKFNHWPVIDASNNEQNINSSNFNKCHTVEYVENVLRVVGWEEKHLNDLHSSSVDIIEVTKFSYYFDTNLMKMTAYDFPNLKNIEDFRENLKFNLKSTDNDYI